MPQTEALPRFRKETKGLSSFQPINRWAGWLGCITHIHSELGRLGRDTYSLAPYQHRILSELQGGFDEEAIARMFWWWHYDTSRLVSELERGNAMPKPRVELCVDITTKENLSVTWEPAGIVNGRPGPKCDWRQWHRIAGGFNRPSNELVFVRDVGHAAGQFESYNEPLDMDSFPASLRRPDTEAFLKRSRREYKQKNHAIDGLLLQATAGLVNELKQRLDLNFSVRMVSDIFMDFETRGDRSTPGRTTDQLARWKIENVEMRKRRLGLEEINAFKKKLGFPLQVFVDAMLAARYRKDGKPVEHEDRRDARATQALKDAGHTIALGQVGHYRSLLEQFRPDLMPRMADPKVTPFRRPNGNGSKTQH